MFSNCLMESDCDCDKECYCSGRECDCVRYGDLFDLQAEAETNLAAIFTTQVAYFGENNTYAHTFTELAWLPEPETRYAYFLPDDEIQPTLTGPYPLPPGVNPAVSQTGFTCVAVSNIDCDDTLDVWMLNDQYRIFNFISDITK